MIVLLFFIALSLPPFYSGGKAPDYFLVGSIEGGTPVARHEFLLKNEERLVISLVIREGDRFISSVKRFAREGQEQTTSSRRTGIAGISWHLIKPRIREYSNLWLSEKPDVGNVHMEPIEYVKVPVSELADEGQFDIGRLRLSRTPGTFYLCVEITAGTAAGTQLPPVFSEISPLHLKYPYRVIQVSYRSDNSYIGYLTELFRTPFLVAPMVTDQGVHETDARMGSDCAAFAIYGKRRQGYRVPYCGPAGIYDYLTEIEESPLWPRASGSTEVYANDNGRFVKVGPGGLETGDILHFGEQVSVFYADAGIPGLLDKDDYLIQCYQGGPLITTIEKSGFYQKPVRIFRWKENLVRAKGLH